MNHPAIPSPLREDMTRKGIDIGLSLEILEDFNAGKYDEEGQVVADGVPLVDGSTVIDLRQNCQPNEIIFRCSFENAGSRLRKLECVYPISEARQGNEAIFSRQALASIGNELLSRTAYGVLNGGSATSYADIKKNRSLAPAAFEVLAAEFHSHAQQFRDLPKGMTPAYFNPDGTPGASFLELKMRARLLLARSALPGGNLQHPLVPLFQMTSTSTHSLLAGYYPSLRGSPFLKGLAETCGLDPVEWMSGVQPLISAYTHSSEGRPKRLFDKAFGKENSSLALPGGHGQSFRVLATTLRKLHEAGIRYACLGNVDNLGFTPDPVEIAILALSGQPAAFDFAARTPMDIKGGILVSSKGRLTIADIGPAIRFEDMLRLEADGHTILFNCASGIFDLDYLVPRIDELARRLPVRFTDQDKDSGRYSQAEQVTWEVTGILPSFLAFVVEKRKRFLAAKLFMDTLLTSGLGLTDARMPESIRNTATGLNEGLSEVLRDTYGLVLSGGKWVPDDSFLTRRPV